jgi:hypothetical protein
VHEGQIDAQLIPAMANKSPSTSPSLETSRGTQEPDFSLRVSWNVAGLN